MRRGQWGRPYVAAAMTEVDVVHAVPVNGHRVILFYTHGKTRNLTLRARANK